MASEQSRPSLWQVIKSVAASAFGVQSQKNYQQDFQQTSFLPFLIVGITFVVLFVMGLVGVVNLAISA